MTDIDALITEATELSESWAKLDAKLVGKLREFASWMREKFPITTAPSPHRYNPPIQYTPAAHRLFPTPGPQESWIELHIESPSEGQAFAFISDDGLGNGKGWFYLPFAWLQDPEGFHQMLLTQTYAAEQEAANQATELRAKEADRLRARLAELEAQ